LYREQHKASGTEMNKEELKKYFSEQLSDVDRHQLEKTAQTDAFAYEAMEGFEQESMSDADLQDLSSRLENRVFEKEKVRVINWWKITGIAASIGLVLGLFGGWLLFGLKDEMKSNNVSQKVEGAVKEEISGEINEVANTKEQASALEIEKEEIKPSSPSVIEIKNDAPTAEIHAPEPIASNVAEAEKAAPIANISKPEVVKNNPNDNLNNGNGVTSKVSKAESIINSDEVSISKNKGGSAIKSVELKSETERAPITKTRGIKVLPTDKKVAARTSSRPTEPAYKSAGEEISLGGLADMLKQEQNEAAKDKMSKADDMQVPVIVEEEEKKQEVYKYDYDKANINKKPKTVSDENSREKKSKIKIPLDVLPSNITFEDYVKIKLREKAYRCPKKGSVKLFVNLDKNKKIEDFTILEVNNKVCVDYAKAIVEEWLSEKATMYDENRAHQFVVNFN
jgi:hypothetical protein